MSEHLKIVLIDDDEEEYLILKELITGATRGLNTLHYHLDWASNYEEALRAFSECHYDLYLVDYHLGSHNGLDLLREPAARQCPAPIIMLTGQGSYETDLSAMELGAADYLEKSQLTLPLLERSIRYAIERKQSEAQLKKQADEMAALQKATSSLLQTIDLSLLVGQILDAARQAIPSAEQALLHVIQRRDGNGGRLTELSLKDPRIKKITLPGPLSGSFQKILDGQPLLIGDLQAEPNLLSQVNDNLRRSDVRSAIIAPLILDREFLGTLSLNASRPFVFSGADLHLLTSFAATATAAIHNAILHAEAKNLAATDPLTGRLNRRTFFELGQREIERSQRFNRPLSWIMFDIDLFKEINDRHGHAAGDQVLAVIAQRCAQLIRDVDIFARYGGDEFIILLPETDYEQARAVAERIRVSIASEPVQTDAGSLQVTISMGITETTSRSGDLGLLLNKADQALYKSKRTGRNKITVLV